MCLRQKRKSVQTISSVEYTIDSDTYHFRGTFKETFIALNINLSFENVNVNLCVLKKREDCRSECVTTRVVLTWPGCRHGLVITPGHVPRLFEQVTRQLLARINFITPLLGGGTQGSVRARSPWNIASTDAVIARQQNIPSNRRGGWWLHLRPGMRNARGELTNELCALLSADWPYRSPSDQFVTRLIARNGWLLQEDNKSAVSSNNIWGINIFLAHFKKRPYENINGIFCFTSEKLTENTVSLFPRLCGIVIYFPAIWCHPGRHFESPDQKLRDVHGSGMKFNAPTPPGRVKFCGMKGEKAEMNGNWSASPLSPSSSLSPSLSISFSSLAYV